MKPATSPSPIWTNSRLPWVLVALLILLATIERVYGIDRQSLWGDEIFAPLFSRQKHSLTELWSILVNDSHPPGYAIFMYLTLPVTGYTDFGVRLHALLFGIAWIPLVYWLGKRWVSIEVGILAAALIASSHPAIYYSQEARAYSMLTAFCLLNVLSLLELLFGKTSSRAWRYTFIASSTALLYLHYAGFVFYATEILVYLMLWVSRARIGSGSELAAVFLWPAVFYAPWLGIMINHLTDTSREWAVSASPTLSDLYYVLQRLFGPDDGRTRLTCEGLAILLAVTVYRHVRYGITSPILLTYILFTLAALPIAAFYVESLVWTPIFEKRYFLCSVPLVTLLLATLISYAVDFLTRRYLRRLVLVLTTLVLSITCINLNIDRGLYSELNKDPIREAVNIVARDLGDQKLVPNYTVLMTHESFDHYLMQNHIRFDSKWPYRRYYVAQQIDIIKEYLQQRPKIEFFYYLSLKQPNSNSATYALKQEYKLLSSAEVSVPTGTISVFKFSSREKPESNGEINDWTNQTNEAIKSFANEVGHRDPGSYLLLLTHDWLESYLKRNGISYDNTWPGRRYILDAQLENIVNYLNNHPGIDTIYYLALREENSENAAMILQLRYPLQFHQSFTISIGQLDIYALSTRGEAIPPAELKSRIEVNAINKIAAAVADRVRKVPEGSGLVVMSHTWFEPYLKYNRVPFDRDWPGRFLNGDFQADRIFDYVDKHPSIRTLYYLSLKDTRLERGALPLMLKYRLTSITSVPAAAGELQLMIFNTREKPGKLGEEQTDINNSPLGKLVAQARTKLSHPGNPASYVVLTTHPWYDTYLENAGIHVDQQWQGHIFNSDLQTQAVLNYVGAHPEASTVLYVALANPDSKRCAALLGIRLRVVSQDSVTSALGTITLYTFDTKSPPDSRDAAKAALAKPGQSY